MKVAHLCFSDIIGGAAKAAYRLHSSLRSAGVHSELWVDMKLGRDPTVHLVPTTAPTISTRIKVHLDRLPFRLMAARPEAGWSNCWLPDPFLGRVLKSAVDVIHLHWVGAGMLPIAALKAVEKPIVWTMHDMWPMTGGCHYSGSCRRYEGQCGHCPLLSTNSEVDLSRWNWRRKARSWKSVQLHLVSPSHWLAEEARKSGLFAERPISTIPYGVDCQRFHPLDKAIARDVLGLAKDKRIVLFGAAHAFTEPRKGADLLLSALAELDDASIATIQLVTFGDVLPDSVAQTLRRYDVCSLGTLEDEISVALALAAADVFIAPSREDNLPNAVLEAMAAGTPSVAFDIGGMKDMIVHRQNGWLATPFDVVDLAQGVQWIIADSERRSLLAAAARNTAVTHFASALSASRYIELYEHIVQAHSVS